MEPNEPPSLNEPLESGRRHFLKRAALCTMGAAAVVAPGAATLTVVLNPLFEERSGGLWVLLTKRDALELGGPPQAFRVERDLSDAWTRYPMATVGSVFLQRQGEPGSALEFRAFNAACPHLGCPVDYQVDGQRYFCACHNSAFRMDGALQGEGSPSPRGLDPLRVDVRGDDVWVEFVAFKLNVKESIPIV